MAAPFQEKPVPAMGTPFDAESLPGGSGTVNAKLRLLTDQAMATNVLLAAILMGGSITGGVTIAIPNPIGVSGTVTAIQGTTPWIVSGNVNTSLVLPSILGVSGTVSTHILDLPGPIAVSGTVNVGNLSLPNPLGVSGTVSIGNVPTVIVSGTVNTNVVIPQPLEVSGSVSVLGTVPVSFDQPIGVSGTVNVGNLTLPNPLGVSGTITVNQGASGSVPWSVVVQNELVIASGSTTVARGGVSDISGVCNGTSQLFSPSNPQRTYLLIHNLSSGSIWFNFAFAATSGLSSIELAPSEKFIMQENFVSTDDIFIFGHPGRLWTAKEYPVNLSNDWRLDFEFGRNTTLYIVFGV